MKRINHKSILRGGLSACLVSLFCLMGCGDSEKMGLNPTDAVPPAQPTDIQVENINGGAIITYIPPKEDDLMYVTALYTTNGRARTSKASPYVNELRVDGFGAEESYQIALVSVDKSNNESKPVMVTIHPLTPPVDQIYNSLNVKNSFGGVRLAWENPSETNVIIEASRLDGDEWVSVENFYTAAKVGGGSIRGFDPEPMTFRFRVRDRWDNYSEYKVTENLPIEEIEIDKKKFKAVENMPGDAKLSHPLPAFWDGLVGNNFFHGDGNETSMGRTITFDMGVEVKVSRFKMWQRWDGDSQFLYDHNNLKHCIVYGCKEITPDMYQGGVMKPVSAGELMFPTFEGWTEILDTWCHKPSGDSGKITNEDIEYIKGGDEHEVPDNAPSFRYVRILMLETWSGGFIGQGSEITFWGQIVK